MLYTHKEGLLLQSIPPLCYSLGVAVLLAVPCVSLFVMSANTAKFSIWLAEAAVN